MTANPIDRTTLQQTVEKYEIIETVMLRLSELERILESDEWTNDAGSGFDLKQIASHFKLLDEVLESLGIVEVHVNQLEFLVNSAEKLMNLT